MTAKPKKRGHPISVPAVPTAAQLLTLSGVVMEMANIYREMRQGRLKPDLACKATYVLREIRAALEAQAIERLETKLAELNEAAERWNGHAGHDRPAQYAN